MHPISLWSYKSAQLLMYLSTEQIKLIDFFIDISFQHWTQT